MKSVCFFAKVKDMQQLRHQEFYTQDLRILEDLGFDVHIATTPRDLRYADFYFIWWWTWAFLPVTFAMFHRRPRVITGTIDYTYNFRQRPTLQRWLMEFATSHATANVFDSQLEYQLVPRRLRVNNPRYSPHVVDVDLFRPCHRERDDIVLTVAWMRYGNDVRKCIREVIQATPLVHRVHPKVRFVIAGGYEPFHLQLVHEAGAADYVEFPGIINQETKIDLMQRCKIYLQPSRFEAFGLAILEAMSCGTPVVTSRVGAVSEVVGDTAVFVDGTSPENIASGVNQLLQNEGFRAKLGCQARARAETLFPYERRKQDFQRLFEEIL